MSVEAPDRLILPLEFWPAEDQSRWHTACADEADLDDPNVAASWSARRRQNVSLAYGRYLTWLLQHGALNHADLPGSRVTRDRIAAYRTELASHVSEITVTTYIGNLQRMMVVIAPNGDWSWLARIYSRLKARAKPSRDKRPLMVGSAQLYEFGKELMASVEGAKFRARRRAIRYRDGLIIALLAARPLRIGNFSKIEIGRHLRRQADRYWLIFDADETKNGRPIEEPCPADLTSHLEHYLDRHRAFLVGDGAENRAHRSLWVGRSGEALDESAVREQIKVHTREKFGVAIHPHAFRHNLATSIAIELPEHVRMATSILGQASLATTERYYNMAQMLSAHRAYTATLLEVRHEFAEALDADLI